MNLPVSSVHDAVREEKKKLEEEHRKRSERRATAAAALKECMYEVNEDLEDLPSQCLVQGVSSEHKNNTDEVAVAETLLTLKGSAMSSQDALVQVKTSNFMQTFTAFINEKNACSITGLNSMELLDKLSAMLEMKMNVPARLLCCRDRIVMTMMVSFDFVAHLFACAPSSCGTIIRTTIGGLAAILECAIFWPSKDEILSNLPTCFRSFSKVRAVLDC